LRHRTVELDLDLALERGGDVLFVGGDEIDPLLQPAVATLERDQRRFVRRVDLHHLLQAKRRQIGLQELLFLDGGELHQELDALAFAGDDIELLLETPTKFGPADLWV
jgi:hypothetical protein